MASINRNRSHSQELHRFTDFAEQRISSNMMLQRYFSYASMLSTMTTHRMWTISLLICVLYPVHVHCADPKFDPSTRMRLVLVPADAQVASVIYRLRATDEEFDYPLTFELLGDSSSSTIKIESLPCTKYNSVCQANIILQRRLEPGRYYDFQVSVKDTKGGMASQLCSITATNFSTPHDIIFPHKPGIIMIPEDAKRGTDLDYVIARRNPLIQKPVYMELWGSPLFAIRQKIVSPETTEGTIFLLGPLDFEKQAMYHLTILANDAYAEPGQDSRNIASLEIVVIVQDVQDQPPVFTVAPPVTKLPPGILPGDKILQVHAEDGDKGNPREVRYGLVSEGNPFTSFFYINDTTGEIFLMHPMEDIAAITHVGDPVLLTVLAEEVKIGRDEPPSMATTVQLAFLLPERSNTAPYFENDHYISRVDENAPQGTALAFIDPYVPRVYDDDTGKNGVFSLTLLNNNGTFEISPNVAERSTLFLIRVRDNVLLDYEERQSVQFQIVAQELGPATNLSATVNVTVYINDVNDNPPVFDQPVYTVELPENMTVGTKVVQVHADDVDTADLGGQVRYTAIYGYLNTSLNLDAETGVITVTTNNHGFDREVMPEYHLYVEARDSDGTGNRAQVPLIIKLIDVNDEDPLFEHDLYEFILAPNLQSFTTSAFIHAVDKDATAPNNEVRYEIINGNYENKFALDKISGELTVREKIVLQSKKLKEARIRRQTPVVPSNGDMFILSARAYDLGVPVRFSTTTIRIYPPESRTRSVTFVVPGANPDKAKTEDTLSTITGGKVIIHDIRPLQPDEPGATKLVGGNGNSKDRSVVSATVLYDSSSVVDISEIQQRLSQHNSSYAIMTGSSAETDTLTPLQTLYKAENKLLFWLLILLATLVALTILILLLCCICSWCPLYGAASKRIVNFGRSEDDIHLVHREMANGKQTKSVQVAEWMGRREAWSAEKPSDSRTKPTRWEFHNGREQLDESLTIRPSKFGRLAGANEKRLTHSAEEQRRRVRIKNNPTAKDDIFHNSRTNLIDDRDVCVEDITVEREVADETGQFNRRRANRQMKQHKRYDAEVSHIDDDSMRRHEIDRGSDIDYNTARSSLENKREFYIKDGNAEILQLMTREKDRDGTAPDHDNIYVNVPVKSTSMAHPQLLMIDNSGKEILMRRFIEDQPDGKQIIREHYQIVPGATYIQSMPNEIQQTSVLKDEMFPLGKSGPNSIVYSQAEPEIKVIHTQSALGVVDSHTRPQVQASPSNQLLTQELENSLKQQNELLRQILLEKGKLETRYMEQEMILETQSLPGQSVAIATQTECEVGTQTDADVQFSQRTSVVTEGVTLRRKARSDNDDFLSEDEYEYVRYSPPNSPEVVYWVKRKRSKKRAKYYPRHTHPRRRDVLVEDVKRKIRTPIKEEDDEGYENVKVTSAKKPVRRHGETRTSILRRKNNEKVRRSLDSERQTEPLKREILMEISDSLDERQSPREQFRHKMRVGKIRYYEQTSEGEELENFEDIERQYSEDSDADEIVIKNNVYKPSRHRTEGSAVAPKSSNGLEVHLHENEISDGSHNDVYSRSSSEQRDGAIERKPRRARVSSEHPESGQAASKSSQNSVSKLNSFLSDGTQEVIVKFQDSKRLLKERLYQSENDLLNVDKRKKEVGVDPRAVPKYMKSYSDQNKSSKNEGSLHSLKNQAAPKKKSNDAQEKHISKTRLSAKFENKSHNDKKYKPEPVPRKSLPKNSGLLKEDITMNKQHKPSIETDTNHPLLQHSEYRFERENATEIPVPPTKLPHYMYPETPPYAATRGPISRKLKFKPSPIKENEVKTDNSKMKTYVNGSNVTQTATAAATLQHTQKQLNASTLEDDLDSGIAMNSLLNTMGRRNPIADKKSVFSIAYDDVSGVTKIASGGESPQY